MENNNEDVTSNSETIYPFDPSIHLRAGEITEVIAIAIHELRSLLVGDEFYDAEWCSDHVLHMFLIARNMNVAAARDMLSIALSWRRLRPLKDIDTCDELLEKMNIEGSTGKVYNAGMFFLNLLHIYNFYLSRF